MVSNDVTGFPKKETSLDPETKHEFENTGRYNRNKRFWKNSKKKTKNVPVTTITVFTKSLNQVAINLIDYIMYTPSFESLLLYEKLFKQLRSNSIVNLLNFRLRIAVI